MKNKLFPLAILLIAFAGVGAWYLNNSSHSKKPSNEVKESKSQKKYLCPMHPEITADHPSSCPICGMDLVKLEEFESDDSESGDDSESHTGHETDPARTSPSDRSSVKLNLKKQQLIGVKTAPVHKQKLFKTIRTPGRVAFDPELYTAQSEYLEALKQWKRVKDSPIQDVKENTRQMIQSSKIRLKVLGLSENQISSLARKGFQSEGLLVGGTDNVVYADVFEVDLPFIKEGQSAQITANFLQGKSLPGKVTSVDRVINPETRTAKVRIELLESDGAIRPESYVNIQIFSPVGTHLSVPIDSIFDTGTSTFVFVKSGDGRFDPVSVKVILETQKDVAILGNIKPGDQVVVGANFMIDSESRLNSVLRSAEDKTNSQQKHNH